MQSRRATHSLLILACLLAVGCETVPMSYSEWKQEQDKRARFARAGVPYKSPSELREEAAAMRRAAQDSNLTGNRK